MLTTLRYLFYTELLLLIRRKEEWLYPLSFFVIVICLFPLAFNFEDANFLQKTFPGCVWMATIFATLLGLQAIFLSETEEGHLDQLVLSDLPLTLLISIKLFCHWLLNQFPIILFSTVLAYLFHFPYPGMVAIVFTLLLGTPILVLLGSLIVALTLGLRQAGVLLGLMLIPLIMPVLIFGVNITSEALAGFSIRAPLAFLAGISVLSVISLPFLIAAALRMVVED